jgi:aldose 1-epimerase
MTAPAAQRPPSGEQHEIAHGGQRAVVVEVGGGIREYAVDGRDVLQSYDRDAMCDGAHGAVLVPWPNRIGDGRYTFDAVEHQLALSEVSTATAIHGLLRWVPWQCVAHLPDTVTMAADLHPSPGYPYDLRVEVAYSLAADGLTVRTTVTNTGDADAPVGLGHHPYLWAGGGPVDDAALELPAATRLTTDARQLPVGREAVAGTGFDFRAARTIGATRIDHAFTDLVPDGDGRCTARLTGSDARTVELWVDAAYRYLEVYTGDTLAPGRARLAVAVEPMTCPPDAFRTGEDVVRLRPGATTAATWGTRLVDRR